MLGRFACVRVRVMTAAPLPGVSPLRRGSREATTIREARSADGAARETKSKRTKSAIPARNRVKSGCGSAITFDLFELESGAARPGPPLPNRPPHLGAVNSRRQRPTLQQQDHQFAGYAQEARTIKKGRRKCRP